VSIKNFIWSIYSLKLRPLFHIKYKKVAGYSHRTAQPPILAVFLPWGGSAGAGRVRPAVAKLVKSDRFS